MKPRKRHRHEVELRRWLRATAQPGDLVLLGALDPASVVIQLVLRCKYSHAALVLPNDRIIEMYDRYFPKRGVDEGVFEKPLCDLVARSHKLSRVAILRPSELELSRFLDAVQLARDTPRRFPSVGVAVTGILALSLLAPKIRQAIRQSDPDVASPLDVALNAAGDGDHGASCGEFAARIYSTAGVALTFHQPALLQLFAYLSDQTPESETIHVPAGTALDDTHLIGWTSADRDARPDWEKHNRLRRLVGSAEHIKASVKEAFSSSSPPDIFDLVTPGDFLRIQQFEVVSTYRKRVFRPEFTNGQIEPTAPPGSR